MQPGHYDGREVRITHILLCMSKVHVRQQVSNQPLDLLSIQTFHTACRHVQVSSRQEIGPQFLCIQHYRLTLESVLVQLADGLMRCSHCRDSIASLKDSVAPSESFSPGSLESASQVSFLSARNAEKDVARTAGTGLVAGQQSHATEKAGEQAKSQ